MATYSNLSPWFNTEVKEDYLDVLTIRPVSAEPDDVYWTITAPYAYRPDILAYDLYGEPALWWVFMQRNLDVIQDPVFDFVPGVQIYIPKNSSLRTILGI
jgi:hypothetical protein